MGMLRPNNQNHLDILIVEDDEDDEEDFEIISMLLPKACPCDFTLTWEKTLKGSVNALKASAHDLYLIDFKLGSESGFDVLQEVHRLYHNPTCIMMSGLKMAMDLDLGAIRAGASDYLPKDELNAENLSKAIEFALERSVFRDTQHLSF